MSNLQLRNLVILSAGHKLTREMACIINDFTKTARKILL